VDSKQAIVLGFGAFSFDMLFLAKSSFLLSILLVFVIYRDTRVSRLWRQQGRAY